jgi:hypothetical protein
MLSMGFGALVFAVIGKATQALHRALEKLSSRQYHSGVRTVSAIFDVSFSNLVDFQQTLFYFIHTI